MNTTVRTSQGRGSGQDPESAGADPGVEECGIPRRWSILWEGEERLPERDSLVSWFHFRVSVAACMLASLLALFACGQAKEEPRIESQLGEFVGIQLGESVSTATEKMLAKRGVTFLSDSSDIVFRGGELLGTPVDEWILSFWRGERFWFLQVHLTVDSASSMLTYESMRMALIAQYGPPTNDDAERPGGVRGLSWRETVKGSSKDNVLSIMLMPDGRVMVWFAGFGYIDTVEGKSS